MDEYKTTDEIRSTLKDMIKHPTWIDETSFPRIYDNLVVGSHLLKQNNSLSSRRERFLYIDSLAVVDAVKGNSLDIKAIHASFKHRTDEPPYSWDQTYYDQHARDISGKQSVPLSELVRDKVGDCLEMATLIQLLAQSRRIESYLLSGHLVVEDESPIDHSWSVVLEDGVFHVLDAARNFRSPIRCLRYEEDRGLILVPVKEKPSIYLCN